MNASLTIRTALGCLTFLALFILSTGVAANAPFTPAFKPELAIRPASGSVHIDGNLDEAAWKNAATTSGYVERNPGDNIQPDVATRTFVTFDRDNLYVAFVCDDDPATLRATMCQRDQYVGDDCVIVFIDTYDEAVWAYEFFVNPHGIQKDYLWSNVHGEDPGFDMVWSSAAKVTDSGYQVEMAIPFAAMRFPNRDVQSWRMDFWRNRPRDSNHQYSWAANDRNEQCFPCKWGTVTGIEGARPGRGLEVLPTYVAFQSSQLNNPGDPDSPFEDGDILGELSLGGKYAVSSDATLEASYNPDFSQIEGDAAQVDVNTTIALFYPERRPFFQEGSDVFLTLFNSFYTRTVNDPEYAVKLVSRKPGYTLGFMSAQDENTPYMVPLEESTELFVTGRSWVNVLRASRSFGTGSQFGFIATDRRLEGGGYGTILALDGDIRLAPSYGIDGQFLASFTGEPAEAGSSAYLGNTTIDEGRRTAKFDGESFAGNAFITRLKHFARDWSSQLTYSQCDPDYRTETGYDPWVNYRDASWFNSYTFYFDNGLLQRLQPNVYAEARWRYDGVRRWEHLRASLTAQLRWAQTSVTILGTRGTEDWTSQVTGTLIPYDKLYSGGLSANSQLNDKIGCYAEFEYGRSVALFAEAIGRESRVEAGLDLKPIDRLLVSPDFDFVRSVHTESNKELFRQFIARTRINLQVNRELSLRLIVQYNKANASFYLGEGVDGPEYFEYQREVWDVDPLLTYRLSSFSVLHAGSTHHFNNYPVDGNVLDRWELSSRQFFVKLQYLFQV
jgi:hypothetical protein